MQQWHGGGPLFRAVEGTQREDTGIRGQSAVASPLRSNCGGDWHCELANAHHYCVAPASPRPRLARLARLARLRRARARARPLLLQLPQPLRLRLRP